MNDDQNEDSIDTTLHSAEWYAAQATALIKEYKACRTEHARNLLIPKLKHIYFKLGFERRGIAKLMNEGEEWKDEA